MLHGNPRARGRGMLVISVLLFVGLLVLSRMGGGGAHAFSAPLRLREASARAAADGKPVLVLVSADWCGPCGQYERGALADRGVRMWVEQNTHPVLLDASDRNRPDPEIERLRVYSLPTLVLLRDGKEAGRLEGVHGASDLLGWLAQVSGPMADWKAAHPGEEPPTGAAPSGK